MSKKKIEQPSANSQRLGAWLRALRQSRDVPLRVVAAAAEMDTALLSKIELGQRLPTEKQAASLATFFDLPSEEIEAKRIAEKFWHEHNQNPAAMRAVSLIKAAPKEHNHSTARNVHGK